MAIYQYPPTDGSLHSMLFPCILSRYMYSRKIGNVIIFWLEAVGHVYGGASYVKTTILLVNVESLDLYYCVNPRDFISCPKVMDDYLVEVALESGILLGVAADVETVLSLVKDNREKIVNHRNDYILNHGISPTDRSIHGSFEWVYYTFLRGLDRCYKESPRMDRRGRRNHRNHEEINRLNFQEVKDHSKIPDFYQQLFDNDMEKLREVVCSRENGDKIWEYLMKETSTN